MAVINFDARNVQPDEGRNSDPLPAGWYVAAMSKSEIKPTKDGVNAMLACEFDIMDPAQFKGRKVFFNFNIQHTNPQTVDIAYKQLSAVCHSVGMLTVSDSQELHGRPLKLKLKVRPATTKPDGSIQYPAANDIDAFKNVNDPAAVDGPKAAAPAAFAPPAAPSAGAWVPPTVQHAAAPAAAWAPPAAPAAPPVQAAPAWQPPPGAVAQPWAAQLPPAAPQQAQAAPPTVAPPGMPPAWAPPAPAGAAVPPWEK